MLNLLHKASNELETPGNLFLATSRESITKFLSISFFFIDLSSPFKKLRSNEAL